MKEFFIHLLKFILFSLSGVVIFGTIFFGSDIVKWIIKKVRKQK